VDGSALLHSYCCLRGGAQLTAGERSESEWMELALQSEGM
jgi:hypothetical protein